MPVPFKVCTCGKTWEGREDMLADPHVCIIGYQVDFETLDKGLFLFNHHVCKTTLGLYASSLQDLYSGPVYHDRKTGGEECPEYCLHKDNLEACPAKCACAHLRQVIQMIKEWPKKQA